MNSTLLFLEICIPTYTEDVKTVCRNFIQAKEARRNGTPLVPIATDHISLTPSTNAFSLRLRLG